MYTQNTTLSVPSNGVIIKMLFMPQEQQHEQKKVKKIKNFPSTKRDFSQEIVLQTRLAV